MMTGTRHNGSHGDNITIYASGTEVMDSMTGDIVQTLPPVSSNTMQFLSLDGMHYGLNMMSAASLGLNPSMLRDYDGNNLGSASGWQMKGLASVRVGADPSYILTNSANGRWAEVAVQANGGFNFDNYGQNGDTRVVGIYQDPLVQAGIVQANSPFDSQTRFLGDVTADRLAVLGSMPDPMQSSFEDLFFKLTNHAADHHDDVYLRAIMWGDGNIQYANYMNASQFTDWMSKAGTPSGVYSDWMTRI